MVGVRCRGQPGQPAPRLDGQPRSNYVAEPFQPLLLDDRERSLSLWNQDGGLKNPVRDRLREVKSGPLGAR